MRILIAEDDMTSGRFMSKFLSQYAEYDLVVDGMEVLEAYLIAIKEKNPYDLIYLDIMMPKVDGVKILKAIRDFETKRGLIPEEKIKIIMITALDDTKYVNKAFELGCDAYVTKPFDTDKLIDVMKNLEIHI